MAEKGKLWIGVAIGVAAGAVTALLTTPKSGEQMRHDIGEGARDVGRKAGQAWGGVKDSASNMASKAQSSVKEAARKGGSMVENTRERAQVAISAGRQAADKKRKLMEAELKDKER